MQRIPKPITPAQLTTSAAAYYTTPSATWATISALTLTNTSAGTVTVSVYLVPSGDTAGADNCILSDKALTADQTYNVMSAIGQNLSAGYTVQAIASAGTSVAIVGSVYETTY